MNSCDIKEDLLTIANRNLDKLVKKESVSRLFERMEKYSPQTLCKLFPNYADYIHSTNKNLYLCAILVTLYQLRRTRMARCFQTILEAEQHTENEVIEAKATLLKMNRHAFWAGDAASPLDDEEGILEKYEAIRDELFDNRQDEFKNMNELELWERYVSSIIQHASLMIDSKYGNVLNIIELEKVLDNQRNIYVTELEKEVHADEND